MDSTNHKAQMPPYLRIIDPVPRVPSMHVSSIDTPRGSAREKSKSNLCHDEEPRPQPEPDPSDQPMSITSTKKRKRGDHAMRLTSLVLPQKKVKQHLGKHIRFNVTLPVTSAASSSYSKFHDEELDELENQNNHLANALRHACDNIKTLKFDLANSESKIVSEERSIRQQMLLDFMLKQEQLKKECERTSARHIRIAATMKYDMEKKMLAIDELKRSADEERKHDREAREKLHQQYQNERNKYLNALSTSNLYQSSLEHCQQLLKTTEEDLAELQRIHNEEKAVKAKATRGLPPSYGSLDDVEVTPPWGKHEDGGTLDMAQVKHTVRHRFTRDLHNAQSLANTYRESQDMRLKASSGVELFRLSSLALQEACISLREILDNADDVDISPRSKKRQKRRQGRTFEEQRQTPVSRCAYIADRSAKLILDLGWRLISIFDLRPQDVRLTPQLKTELGLYWRKIDDVFIEAIKATFHATAPDQRSDENDVPIHRPDGLCPQCKSNQCPGHCVRVTELQFFLTHLKNVSKRLDQITNSSELRGTYFVESFEWLTESVETERRLAANSNLPRVPTLCPHVSHLMAGAGGSSADAALMARLNERPAQDDETATVADENIEALAEQAARDTHVERARYARARARAMMQVQEADIARHAQYHTWTNNPDQQVVPGASSVRGAPREIDRWREVDRDDAAGTRTLHHTDGVHSELRLERLPPPSRSQSQSLNVRARRADSVESGSQVAMAPIRERAMREAELVIAARHAPGGDLYQGD